MCFSAEADFAVAAVVAPVGVATLRAAARAHDQLLAALPLLPALHQLTEGVVWLGLEGDAPGGLRDAATRAYLPRRAGGQAGLTTRATLVAREAISTGLRVMVSLATGFLYAMPRGELWAIRYRNVWTPAQQRAAVAFSVSDVRHALLLAPAWRPAFRSSRSPRGWATADAPADTKITNTTARLRARDGRMASSRARRTRRPRRGRRCGIRLARDASPSVRHIRIAAVMCPSDSAIDAREQRLRRACGSQRLAAVCKKVTAK
jgi:hypothetical protein